MRSIVVSEGTMGTIASLRSYELKSGEEAYQFLLEVICGLHSKLLGETEILGQFKEFNRQNESCFTPGMKEVIHSLFRDAKAIRTEFLQNLGCHSYGSLLRKSLQEKDSRVVFVGAGLLVKDILPWIAKKKVDIQVYTRQPEKHSSLIETYENVQVLGNEKLNEAQGDVLVVAAPVSREWLEEQMNISSFKSVYDLRGNSDSEKLNHNFCVSLHHFIGDIEKNQIEARRIKLKALEVIKEKSSEKFLIEKPRPFGWEDLWAYS